MEFGFSVQNLLTNWLMAGSADTALLNGNNLNQRILMNPQLMLVIDNMGIASAVVTTL